MSSRGGRALRRVGRAAIAALRALLGAAALVVLLVASAVAHLWLGPPRAVVCAQVERLVDDQLAGRLEVGRCVVRPALDVRLEDVVLYAPDGPVVARVPAVTAVPDLAALVRRELTLASVVVERPWVSLVQGDDGAWLALAALEPAEPSPDTGGPSPTVRFDRIELVDGRVVDAPGAVALDDLDAAFALVLSPTPETSLRAEVEALSMVVAREGREVARLVRTEASVALGPGERSSLSAAVTLGDEGSAEVDATAVWAEEGPATATLAIDAPHAELAALGLGVEGVVSGRVRVEAEDLDGERPIVTVAAEDLRYREWSLPAMRARAEIGEDAVVVETLDLPHLTGEEGHLRLDARVGFDGTVDATVDAYVPRLRGEPNLERLAPEARGSLRLRASVELDAAERVDVALDFALEDAVLPGVAAERLTVDVSAEGALPTPSGRAVVTGRGITAAGTTLSRLDVALVGGPDGYRLDGDVALEDGPAARLAVSAAIEGDVARGSVEARVTEVPAGPLDLTARGVVVRLGESASVDRLVVRGAESKVVASGRVTFDGAADVELALDPLALGPIDRALELGAGLDGELRGELRWRGRPERAAAELELRARQVRVAEVSTRPIDAVMTASLTRRDRASMVLSVYDDRGLVVEGGAEVELNVGRLLAGASPLAVLDDPWRIDAWMPRRDLAALPFAVPAPPVPLSVALTMHLEGDGRGAEGQMLADVMVDQPGTEDEAVLPGGCRLSDPRVELEANLANDETVVEARVEVDGRRVAVARTQLATPLATWARGGLGPLPPLDVRAEIDELRLATLPEVCRAATGRLDGELVARDVLGAVTGRLDVMASDLVFRESEGAIEGRVVVALEPDVAHLEASLDEGGTDVLDVSARVPVARAPSGAPSLGRGDLHARASLAETPFALLAAPLPMIARPSGTLAGELAARGTGLEDLVVDGELTLDRLAFTLLDPFFRVASVTGRIRVDRERLELVDLVSRDLDGRLRIDGSVGLDGLEPTRIDLDVEADDYPVRNEGVQIMVVSGALDAQGQLAGERPRVRVGLERLAIRLTDQLGQDVLDLEPHPAVIYEGEPGWDRSLAVREALARHRGEGAYDPEAVGPVAAANPDEVLVVLVVETTSPIWVRRQDFSIQVSIDAAVELTPAYAVVSGDVDVRRGFLEILGRSFDFEPGTLTFTGAVPPDPRLDLRATHEVSSGDVVTVNVGGTLSAPELSFSSTDPDARTDAEILASVLGVAGGRGDQGEAEDQVRSALAGLTAGLIGSMTRSELGEYLPVLSVESGGTGDTTRVRAGFQADALIPDALDDVIQGLYVEGALGGSEEVGQSVRAGFVVEVFFPRSLSAAASYEQPDNWSLDLRWEP